MRRMNACTLWDTVMAISCRDGQQLRDQVVKEQTMLKEGQKQAVRLLNTLRGHLRAEALGVVANVVAKLEKEEKVEETEWEELIRSVKEVVVNAEAIAGEEKKKVSAVEATKNELWKKKQDAEVEAELAKRSVANDLTRCVQRVKELEDELEVGEARRCEV